MFSSKLNPNHKFSRAEKIAFRKYKKNANLKYEDSFLWV
jgi:hypothetical protein